MKVGIEITEASNGKFSNVYLTFKDLKNNEQKVAMFIPNFVSAFDFTKDIKSIKFDFFLISALVYGLDSLLNREYYSNDGWARDIEATFPVYHLEHWEGQESLLQEALSFLTGDYWQIKFEKNHVQNCFLERKKRWSRKRGLFQHKAIKATSLFSGGLDSLIGVIDTLEKLKEDEEILLVSHFDPYSSGPNRDQLALFQELSEVYPKKVQTNWIQTKLALRRINSAGEKFHSDGNHRSRSFFFIGLGCFLSPSSELIIPENGTISINYPLTPSRVSSLSTRTTHPLVLSKLQTLLNNIGIDVKLINPYNYLTKGEMVSKCLNKKLLVKALESSTSCGKSGHTKTWINKDTKHCGVCMPCLYRRAALNKNGLDTQIYGRDITKPLNRTNFVDLPAIINFLNSSFDLDKMKRDILINGSIPLEYLEEYAKMVLRSREEVMQLFIDKGNALIKSELGIK